MITKRVLFASALLAMSLGLVSFVVQNVEPTPKKNHCQSSEHLPPAVTACLKKQEHCSKEANRENYIAHEWGTFTSLHSSDGRVLAGLEQEEQELPKFVYQHHWEYLRKQIGPIQPPQNQKGMTNPYTREAMALANVTVKMETPVLYFYAQEELEVDVHVDFPRGSISQWYPQRTGGETAPDENTKKINFAKDYNGSIDWKARVVAPNSGHNMTFADGCHYSKFDNWKHWAAPRDVDANLVEVGGYYEKFLFYRGLGNFDTPVGVKFENGQLKVSNNGAGNIPHAVVYEQTPEGSKVWWAGSLQAGAAQKVDFAKELNSNYELGRFGKALVDAGLYEKEAIAMLSTWEESYFKKEGLRVFWILPEAFVDEILPLQLSPQPTELKRVFVGRADIMRPQFEQDLVANYKSDPDGFDQQFASHRYKSAFANYLKDK